MSIKIIGKMGIELVISAGVSEVVKNVVQATLPDDVSKWKKISIAVGGAALGMYVSHKVTKHVMEEINDIVDTMKEVKENFTEVTEEFKDANRDASVDNGKVINIRRDKHVVEDEVPVREEQSIDDIPKTGSNGYFFESMREASDILAALKGVIDLQGYATVNDLNNMLALSCTPNGVITGWYSLQKAKILKQGNLGYLLSLPMEVPLQLNENN